MKILAIICEFNPFHNGHKYLIEKAKRQSDCDAVLCIMSGNFTQRGEVCIFDKYTRARHAIAGGADCVIQLPAPFAVAPAEIFAKGAIKILSSIPDVTEIAFGCESEDDFIEAAELLIDESALFKKVLSEKLDAGESYVKSYAAAFAACGGKKELVENPNNILGLEYAKAILRANANIKLSPVLRMGAGYNDETIKENFSSASAIRKNLSDGAVKRNVPEFVYADFNGAIAPAEFENAARFSLFNTSAADLKKVCGCGEGLENKLKALENESYEGIVEKATSKRYSSSRIRRILCANMLGLHGADTESFLKSDLYIKPLAIKKDRADEILSALAKSGFPVVCGISDDGFSAEAKKCFGRDKYEFALYKHISRTEGKDYMILI